MEKYSEPDRLLDTVWRIPGRLHPEMVFGEIKPGALANLVVWDVEHPAFWPSTDVLRALSMNRVVLGIEQMMVAGKWIGESGHYQQSLRQSDAYEAHRREARSRLEGLLRRCGLE